MRHLSDLEKRRTCRKCRKLFSKVYTLFCPSIGAFRFSAILQAVRLYFFRDFVIGWTHSIRLLYFLVFYFTFTVKLVARKSISRLDFWVNLCRSSPNFRLQMCLWRDLKLKFPECITTMGYSFLHTQHLLSPLFASLWYFFGMFGFV